MNDINASAEREKLKKTVLQGFVGLVISVILFYIVGHAELSNGANEILAFLGLMTGLASLVLIMLAAVVAYKNESIIVNMREVDAFFIKLKNIRIKTYTGGRDE